MGISRGKVGILAYHRVVTADDIQRHYIEPGMYVLRDVFEMQIRWLVEHYDVISFSELFQRWQAHVWDPEKAYCVLTFDDGWLDNYRYAFPILKKYQVPATIFLPTNYIGSNEWFWTEKISFLLTHLSQSCVTATQRARAGCIIAEASGGASRGHNGQNDQVVTPIDEIIGRCKILIPGQIDSVINRLSDVLEISFPNERVTVNWDEVAEMANHGISFGSHSCSHHLMTRLSEEAVRFELEESDRILRSMTRGYIPVFCYPNGDNNDTIQQMVRSCQYMGAVGTKGGVETSRPNNVFQLNRIGMHNDISATAPLLTFHLFRAALGI